MKRVNMKRVIIPALLAGVLVAMAGPVVWAQGANEDPGAARPTMQTHSLLDFIRAGGPVGYTIMLLSVASVALVVQLDDPRPPCRHEPVLRRDEEGVEQDQDCNADELVEESHAPTRCRSRRERYSQTMSRC